MTRAPTRTSFHSSRLVRMLADLAQLQTLAPGNGFAEKLGLWVDYTHAIALCAVHNAGPDSASPVRAATAATATATSATIAFAQSPLHAEFTRLRDTLESAIRKSSLPEPEWLPELDAAPVSADTGTVTGTDSSAPLDARALTSAYEPYRRYYAAQQRDMELKVGPLRARVREQLAQASPALQQLAALDAALDGILCERESRLLYSVPQLLKRRFAHLRAAPQASVASGVPPSTWQLRFGHELQTVLLAELDVRLQPTQGLLEALHNQKPHAA